MNIYEHYIENQPAALLGRSDWSRSYWWYLRGWLPADKGAALLDVGCGEGPLLQALAAWGYTNVLGIESRPEAVATCCQKGFNVICADARTFFEKRDSKYDVVFLIDVLEHFSVEEAISFLIGIKNCLSGNGKLIVQVPNLASPFGPAIFFGDITHKTGFTPDSLVQIMRSAGLVEMEIRPAGPGFWSWRSACRWAAWKLIAMVFRACNLVETGNLWPQPITRVMLGIFKAR